MEICQAVLQPLSGRKWYIKNLDFFRDFILQSFWSVKLTAIPRRTANNFLLSIDILFISSEWKTFLRFNDEYLQNFEFTFEKGSMGMLTSAGKFKNLSFFFMDLLTNYEGVIVLSINFYCFQQSLSGTK